MHLGVTSSRDLFSGREIAAAFSSGKNLVRITSVLRIKYPAQRAHAVQVVPGKLLLHKIDFLDANAVFAGHTASQINAFLQNVHSCGYSIGNLVDVAFIIQDQRMDVAITSVENIRDPK